MATDLTYKALRAQTASLAKNVTRNAEAVQESAKVIEEEALETLRESEQLAVKSVDRDSVADSQALSRVISGVAEGITAYAAKGQDTARQARKAGDQATASHGGFQEAFDRSNVDGLEHVSRDWFEQE